MQGCSVNRRSFSARMLPFSGPHGPAGPFLAICPEMGGLVTWHASEGEIPWLSH